ncbi:hypothetical protein ACFZBC_18700 [Streptomyces luteogriseus]|uniref:hypothetical protein n=1 Tax=Streptomyces luteogriseus TaxID=68233 RepID=UPI0036E35B93
MERVACVRYAGVSRPGVEPVGDAQPRRLDGSRQRAPVARPEPFGEVGQDEPALAAGVQPAGRLRKSRSNAPPAS